VYFPRKSIERAIRIAKQSGLPLKVAAKVDKADQHYFNTTVESLFKQSYVEFIGEISEAQKPAFLCGAKALLFPIDWPEPFGLLMIGAMACGTPVISFNHGSVPEVIDHGITGFIVNDEAQALAALTQLHTLSRTRIHAQFEQRFTAEIMIKRCIDVYTSAIEQYSQSRYRMAAG
jgi:glycosyltransferase involved in cell wall biosynthesis